MAMWKISFTPETGPLFTALVKADTMEAALKKVKPEAEAAGIDERRQLGTLQITNEGAWPTLIVP